MPLVKHGDGVAIPDTNRTIISTSIDVWDEDGMNIGFVSQLNRTDARPTTVIRHLDSADAGRVVEQAPAPENNTLVLGGFALYLQGGKKQSLVHRLSRTNISMRSLNGQHIPFDITEKATHPGAPENVQTTYYLGNWLTNYNRPMNIGTVSIAETANITTSWIE